MLPVNGRPLLSYHFDRAVSLDADEIIIVVGHAGQDIQTYFGPVFENCIITYVEQRDLTGPVSAIEQASGLIDDDFILMFGDEYFVQPRHHEMRAFFEQTQALAVCGIVTDQEPASIRKTYSVEHDSSGRIHRLAEKPDSPPNPIKGTGLCFMKKGICDYIKQTDVNPLRNERDFPALLQAAVDDDRDIYSFLCCTRFYNINDSTDIHALLEMERVTPGADSLSDITA